MSLVGELIDMVLFSMPEMVVESLFDHRPKHTAGIVVGEPRVVQEVSGVVVNLRYHYAYARRQYEGQLVRTFPNDYEARQFLTWAKDQNLGVIFDRSKPAKSTVEFLPKV